MAIQSPACLYCGKVIQHGRADKKFCNSGCKDAYYNELKQAEHQQLKKIEAVLKKNRRILKKFYAKETEGKFIDKEQFLKENFEFGFHTHFVISKFKQHEFTFCYDYGYREIQPGSYQVVSSFQKVHVKGGDQFAL